MNIALITLNEFEKAVGIRSDIIDIQTLKWVILIEFLIIIILGLRLMLSTSKFQNLINLKIKKDNEMIIIKEYKKFNS